MASAEEPYHYTESGLPYIRLENIPVYSCCGVESADIEQMDELHKLIAENLILTPRPMTGLELRFLRKEAMLKPQDIAERVGIDPKTVLNWEKAESVNRSADLLVRLLVTSELWEGTKMVEILKQLVELARYTWEPEPADGTAEESVEKDIAELAADNVAYGLNSSHQWSMFD